AFFFSSRRRHTRCSRDWSSDVCSSDLWRPGRAPAMRPYVDRILCLLPFEAAELERLGGPPGVYVGHRLTRDPGVLEAAARQAAQIGRASGRERVWRSVWGGPCE